MTKDIGLELVQLARVHDLQNMTLREIGRHINPEDGVNPQNIKYHWIKQFKAGNMPYPYSATGTSSRAMMIFQKDLEKVLHRFSENLAKDIEKKIRNDLKGVL